MKSFLASAILILAAAFEAVAGPSVISTKGELPSYRWKDGVVKIYVSSSIAGGSSNIRPTSDVLTAIRNSLQAWSDVANVRFQLEFSDRQSVNPAGAAGDGISLITIASTPENVLLFAKDAQTVSAKTRAFFNRRGQITEADIVLNPFQQFSTDGSYGTFDIQSVLTHEIGHFLGLRHSEVLGSIMSDNIAKNDVTTPGEFHPRGLSEPDAAAARDIYGTADLMDDCCAVIEGRLSSTAGRLPRSMRIWAEEASSGRVVGQAESNSDGAFHMGGITAGTYKVYARVRGSALVEEIGIVELEPTDQKTLKKTVEFPDGGLALQMIGLDGKLSEAAVSTVKGTRRTLFVAGRSFDHDGTIFSANSPFIHVDASTQTAQDRVAAVSVASFDIIIDADTPSGIYSIFASSRSSERAVLIGAIHVE